MWIRVSTHAIRNLPELELDKNNDSCILVHGLIIDLDGFSITREREKYGSIGLYTIRNSGGHTLDYFCPHFHHVFWTNHLDGRHIFYVERG